MSAICSATSCSFYDAVGDVEEEVLQGLLPPQQPGAAPGEEQQLIGEDAYQANAGILGQFWHKSIMSGAGTKAKETIKGRRPRAAS